MNDLKINIDVKIKLRNLDDAYWTIADPTLNYSINNYKENFEIKTYIDYNDNCLIGATGFNEIGSTGFYEIFNIVNAQPFIIGADKEKLISLLTAGTIDKTNLMYMLSNYMLSEKITEFEEAIKKGDTPDVNLIEIYKYSKTKDIDYISNSQFRKLDNAIKQLYIPRKKKPQVNIKQNLLYLLKFIKRYPKLGTAIIDMDIKDENNSIEISANFFNKNKTYILTKIDCYKYDINNTYTIPPSQINDIFSDIPLDSMQNKYDYTIIDEMKKTSTPIYVYKLTDTTKEKQKKLLEKAKETLITSDTNPLTKEDIAYLNMKETVTSNTKKDIDGYEYIDTEFDITPEIYKKIYKPANGTSKNTYIPNGDNIAMLSAIIDKIL